ncbi:hypothetical protein HMPREF1322_1632 [Porphyromonas gingivalis W50]|nr:hypothetical protein HMPREF1322_1632 [Porphyromonas gingivalis W50]
MNFTLSTEEKAKGWQYRSASSVVFTFHTAAMEQMERGDRKKDCFPERRTRAFLCGVYRVTFRK